MITILTGVIQSHMHCISFLGNPGDVFFYPGLIQHCSMPNKQKEGSRTGVLMQFLPKWVIPMEDFR